MLSVWCGSGAVPAATSQRCDRKSALRLLLLLRVTEAIESGGSGLPGIQPFFVLSHY